VSEWSGLMQEEIEKALAANLAGRPYAVAVIQGQMVEYVLLAVATEDGLAQCAQSYLDSGYRNTENPDEAESLAALREWLRWANPDDGWATDELDDQEGLAKCLESYRSLPEDQQDGALTRDCVSALKELAPKYNEQGIVLGVTWGEDPQDFHDTAVQINTGERLAAYESEFRSGQVLDPKIRRIRPT